eukprot:jgi/Botrbrau1/9148/Bobra.160_3s0020.2
MSGIHRRYVVLGGGIAGVTCAQELRRLDPQQKTVLVSSDSVLRGVGTVSQISKTAQELEVINQPAAGFAGGNLEVVESDVVEIDIKRKRVKLTNGTSYSYERLCICTGARPKEIRGGSSPRVFVLRDRDTVAALTKKLADSRKVLVVGNGGIALQLVSSLRSIEVVWAIKQGHIGDAFFDLDAAAFLLRELQHGRAEGHQPEQQQQREQPPQNQDAGNVPGKTGGNVAMNGLQNAWVADGQHGGGAGQQPSPQAEPGQEDGLQNECGGGRCGGGSAVQQPVPGIEHRREDGLVHQPQNGEGKAFGGCGAGGPSMSASCPLGARVTAQEGVRGQCQQGRQGALLDGAEAPAFVGAAGSTTDGRAAGERGSASSHQGSSKGGRSSFGRGVGPEWAAQLGQARGSGAAALSLELNCTVSMLEDRSGGTVPHPVRVVLSNGHVHDVDCVVCGIGVEPNTAGLPPELHRSPADGGLLVDLCMKTSVEDVYAAGDVCTVREEALAPDWFQMRLWTQARLMGMRAAQSMAGAEDTMGFSLEIFTHVTRFCGKKVVLLGLYNGQRLDQEPEEDIVTYRRESQVPIQDIVAYSRESQVPIQDVTYSRESHVPNPALTDVDFGCGLLSLVLHEEQIGFGTCTTVR